ncbi:MAG TPA: hypothetical protein VMD47_03500 [Candidatus Acidoferrales bacterium]|nr:hypothetical protein [Candidatus Acidoferrales bacterium]
MQLYVRAARFLAALLLGVLLAGAAADATLDTVNAPRITVPDKSVNDCSDKAQSTLMSVMQNATEAGQGSGEWLAQTQPSPGGPPSAWAIIECHAIDGGGYTASFVCSVQTPTNPVSASDLCTKLATAFGGGQ